MELVAGGDDGEDLAAGHVYLSAATVAHASLRGLVDWAVELLLEVEDLHEAAGLCCLGLLPSLVGSSTEEALRVEACGEAGDDRVGVLLVVERVALGEGWGAEVQGLGDEGELVGEVEVEGAGLELGEGAHDFVDRLTVVAGSLLAIVKAQVIDDQAGALRTEQVLGGLEPLEVREVLLFGHALQDVLLKVGLLQVPDTDAPLALVCGY
mmetsp:Transcript_17513/g.29504  ORF Transcript_17513/g.29504 Transcript_17513/m.29504 type:complete len:209 (-) Transcript_17513:841-1467(-)